ncbi:MAG: hypothetical protein CFH06_00222 [Alphaproteobacteria bacterium MarineAlpha3_Bin5]|nr:hypothetical protein [Magnetovibrio sp.]PPR79808.1 MAG: hypothetical protein CFH06_00222 [Alphaproteobacteria bacterium MarineAlpha3_Bin5]
MIRRLKSGISQLLKDSIFRSWMIGRALRRYPAPAPFTKHQPPYAISALPLKHELVFWKHPASRNTTVLPKIPLKVKLPGQEITLDPENPENLFKLHFIDIELHLARHRFSWLPLTKFIPNGWLPVLWSSWKTNFMSKKGWHWHPYTAAERSVNIIDGTRRFGYPESLETFKYSLAEHAILISRTLEYFGNHNTSNHLSNNGRALYRLGCFLNLNDARELGFKILVNEAKRIFLSNGSLREGSTHYHMILLKNYLDVWLAARRDEQFSEADVFREISTKAIGAAKKFCLPGGMPLIGDISPDSPPSHLAGITSGHCCWTETFPAEEQTLIHKLVGQSKAPLSKPFIKDGWISFQEGVWSALAPVPLNGWPFMPGHAHQDLGSAEIHFMQTPLFIDPGRGAYGDSGEAALYRSASVHGTLQINGADPYPQNKPYYTDLFREKWAEPPIATITSKGFNISHGGFKRLGVDKIERNWRFGEKTLKIYDSVMGVGQYYIDRSLVTPLPAKLYNNKVIINKQFKVYADDSIPQISPITIWHSYGEGRPGFHIIFSGTEKLPWAGSINVEFIG